MAVVGVDVGGTKCLGVALEHGEVVAESRVATPKGAEPVLAAIAELVGELGGRAPMEAVGVGVPGLVDREGVLRFAPNLTLGGAGLDVRSPLEERLGLPVTVDNDATCAAWGERELGAAKGLDDVILVTLGTGIGGGIITDGSVERGANGFAGEVGHMVVDPHGPPCPCGQRGCWERFASGSGLGRLAREAAHAGRAARVLELAGGDPEAVRGEHVTQAVDEGDPEAADVLARFAWWLALGLANLTNIFDPEAFVLGGGLIRAGDALLVPTRTTLRELLPRQRPDVSVLLATLGERAGAVGAACLAATRSSSS
ncbi:MAG TPA: ROK family protein [Acidimicrobiales bacterium]|nr:ROK family protein [Acidimicrobiales bacterium]